MWKRLCLEPTKCSCENGKYLGIIIDNSAITCDESLNEIQTDCSKTTLS